MAPPSYPELPSIKVSQKFKKDDFSILKAPWLLYFITEVIILIFELDFISIPPILDVLVLFKIVLF